MQSEYDFKGADKEIDYAYPNTMMSGEAYEAIQAALRIADRMQRGDVSNEMLGNLGLKSSNPARLRELYANQFRTMAAQMLKEECKDD